MSVLRSVGVWMGFGGLVLALGSAGWSQQASQQNSSSGIGQTSGQSGRNSTSPTLPSPNSPISPNISPSDSPLSPQLEQDQAKMRNLDRQKKLVEDTQKLLTLANDLKAEVDKSNKDTLSLDVIRKADEIEKLAHSVKEKMKGS